jgi:hypothetical protein
MNTAAAIRISVYFSFIHTERKVPLSNANPAFTVPSGVGPKSRQLALGTTTKYFSVLEQGLLRAIQKVQPGRASIKVQTNVKQLYF